ncbi:hypothetical protein BH11ARM1_BH11ARM1_08340 [soil metagenome]
MKEQFKIPAIVVAGIALLVVVVIMGSRAMSAGNLDTGQVKYTPGKPPWAEGQAGTQNAPGTPAGMGGPKIGGN